MLADLFLSLSALIGLAALHRAISARGRREPLNRRFIGGIRITMLLFAGRALEILTGFAGFRVLVLLAAALIPVAVLVLTEGLLRRHAPRGVKYAVGAGAIIFGLAAFVPSRGPRGCTSTVCSRFRC